MQPVVINLDEGTITPVCCGKCQEDSERLKIEQAYDKINDTLEGLDKGSKYAVIMALVENLLKEETAYTKVLTLGKLAHHIGL